MRPNMPSCISAIVALLLVVVAESYDPDLCIMMDGKCTLNIRGMMYANQSQIAQCINAQVYELTPVGSQLTCAQDAPDFCEHVYSSSGSQSSTSDSTVTQTTNFVGCYPSGNSFMGASMQHMGAGCSLNISISTSTGVVEQFEKDLNAMPAMCKDLWNNITVGLSALKNCSTYVDNVHQICQSAAAADCASASVQARGIPINCSDSATSSTTASTTAPNTPESTGTDATRPPPPPSPSVGGASAVRVSAALVALVGWLTL